MITIEPATPTGAEGTARVSNGSPGSPGEMVPGRRASLAHRLGERGMVTAEWAIGVIAAVSLAGLLLALVLHGPLKDLISNIVVTIIKHVAGTAGI